MQETTTVLPRPRLQALPAEVVVTTIAAFVVTVLVVVPVGVLVWRSVTPAGELSLDAYREAFDGVPFREIVWTTSVFAVGASAIALVLGAALAFMLVRTDLPWRRSLFVLVVAPLVLPGVLQTIAWIFLAAPRSGVLSGVPGMPSVFGLGGMIFVEGVRLVPLALLLVAAALRNGDPALEDAALVAGATRRTVIRRVTLPLLRPALAAAALLLVLRSVGSFEVPALLGIPDRTWVFTSRVWLSLGGTGNGPSDTAAASVPLLALTVAGTVALALLLRRPRARAAVTGRAYRQQPIALGKLRRPLFTAVVLYVFVTVALPLGALVWMSTQPFLAAPSGAALDRAGVEAYGNVLSDAVTRTAILNSLLFAGAAALIATAIAVVVSWTALRARSGARQTLDVIAFLPIAVPGLVLGVALAETMLSAQAVLYGTAAALVIGYVARYLPYATRFSGAGLARLGHELEDAARVSGIGWWGTMRRVTVPLAAAAVGAAWLAAFTVALTDVSLSLVLTSPGNEVIGVQIWSLYASGRWDELAALGIVTIVVVLVLGLVAATLARAAIRGARAPG